MREEAGLWRQKNKGVVVWDAGETEKERKPPLFYLFYLWCGSTTKSAAQCACLPDLANIT